MKLEGFRRACRVATAKPSRQSSQVPGSDGVGGGSDGGWEDLELGTNRQEVEVGLGGGRPRHLPCNASQPRFGPASLASVAHRTPWPHLLPRGPELRPQRAHPARVVKERNKSVLATARKSCPITDDRPISYW